MAVASLSRSGSRSKLYRTKRWRVISAVCVLCIALQTALPPNAAGQAGHAAKTRKGPRALGLVELSPNGKATLIPITILVDGKYYDASAYKAAPVPMALWSDTVYEGIQTGVSLGLFTVTGALQRKAANDATEWMAEGRWQSASSLKAMALKKPVRAEPRGMNEDEGPPVLRRGGSEKGKAPEPPATAPPSPAAPGATPVSTSQAATAPTQSSPTPSQPEPAQVDKAPEDKDRPVLKRGQAGALSAEEAQKKAAASTASGHAPTAPPTNTPAVGASSGAQSGTQSGAAPANQTQLIPAISDANGPDLIPYAFNLQPGEEQQFRKQMLALAADEVRAHAGQAASPSPAASKPVSSQRGKAAAAKLVQPDFEDVQLRVFDLGNTNEPELVLMAKARMPQHLHGKQSATPDKQNKDQQSKDQQSNDPQYMITLVARQDVNGELHKALANVTDVQHLDVVPRLELIDAVDVDGDGRGELLFREVAEAGTAFVVYRVIGDRLYPLFQGTLGE